MNNLFVNPNLEDVTAVFKMLRGYVEFRYNPLPECQTPRTPSKVEAFNWTEMPENLFDWNLAKGFLGDDSFFKTKDGNFCLRFRNMKRKVIGDLFDYITDIVEYSYFSDKANKLENGTRKLGYDHGEYLPRTFRLDVRNDGYGIDLTSVMVNLGRKGKQRLFPNACPNIRDTAGEEQPRARKPHRVYYETVIWRGNPRHRAGCCCMDCLGKRGGIPY